MLRLRSALLIVSAVAIAAVAGGCGGGKEKVSAVELRQRADGICREEQTRFDQIQAHAPANASIAADQVDELIDVSEAASSDLDHLEPPGPLQDPYERYLDERDRVVDEMRKGRDAAGDQDSAGYAAAQDAVAEGAAERRRLAEEVGLGVCGSNPRSG